jgi:2-deoxy-D-gluconate 3-dehydrogenase
MIEKGSGKIINIASVLSFIGGYNAAAYSTTKGAVAQLTKSLSNEWASQGVNVNAIAPGYYETNLNTFIMQDEKRFASLITRIPAGRFGKPEELVGALHFLSSSASDYVNGILLPVDGGFLGR